MAKDRVLTFCILYFNVRTMQMREGNGSVMKAGSKVGDPLLRQSADGQLSHLFKNAIGTLFEFIAS